MCGIGLMLPISLNTQLQFLASSLAPLSIWSTVLGDSKSLNLLQGCKNEPFAYPPQSRTEDGVGAVATTESRVAAWDEKIKCKTRC